MWSLFSERIMAESIPEPAKFEGREISKIEFQELSRIEEDAVINKINTKVGESFHKTVISEDIRKLFKMGYFEDIEVQADSAPGDKVNVYFKFKEQPAISAIIFEGNERIDTSDLEEVIKTKEWSILDINSIKKDVELIQKHYEEKGFYLARVSYEIKTDKDASTEKKDAVELIFKIHDYDKVKIKQISFMNNHVYSDNQLKKILMETKEGGMWSFMSGSGNFSESGFKQDLQRLTYWYLDHGYVKFRYEQPIVTVSDDKRWLYISVYLDEGEKYTVKDIDFSGDLLYEKEEFHADLTLLEGEIFSITKRNQDIQSLSEKYQDLGFAFVNVIPDMDVNDEDRTVTFNYKFEKGNLCHFGEINVIGNSKTYDKVLRRELRIFEGELYHGSNLRISKERVERLGYFAPGEVVFNTLPRKDRPDIVDVEIQVKERSTGTITLGAGYGSHSKFFFTTQLQEINLFGRGQTISLQAQYATDKISKSFSFGFTEPYTLDTSWSSGFDIFYVVFPIPLVYQTRKLGFDVRFGYPVTDYINAYITYKNEAMQILSVVDPETTNTNLDSGILSSVVWSMVRDKRNNRFETSDGNFQSMSLETAGVGGDKKFVKWNFNNRFYKRLVGDLVFKNSSEYGQIHRLGGYGVPPSEKFYLGGPNNMKGFNTFMLGPTRVNSLQMLVPTGGTVQMFSLFELEYPLIKEAGLKFVTFYDIGNSFDGMPSHDNFTLRMDAGLGIRWFSPIGPLRFEWGFPFKKRPHEDSPVFVFYIGPPF